MTFLLSGDYIYILDYIFSFVKRIFVNIFPQKTVGNPDPPLDGNKIW